MGYLRNHGKEISFGFRFVTGVLVFPCNVLAPLNLFCTLSPACLLACFLQEHYALNHYVSPFARRLYWRADACASQTLGSLQQDLISTLTCNNQNVARATYLSTT